MSTSEVQGADIGERIDRTAPDRRRHVGRRVALALLLDRT